MRPIKPSHCINLILAKFVLIRTIGTFWRASAGQMPKEKDEMKRSVLLLSIVLTMALTLSACATETAAPEEASPPDQSVEMAEEEPTPKPEPTATTDTGYETFAPFAGA
jgi:hypothetical protein